jgi:hypothetical protein
MEILGSRIENFSHLSTAEIALTRGPTTRVLTSLKALDRSLQSVFTAAGYELRYQRFEPVRRFSQQVSTCFPGRVEGGIAGAQQSQAPVAGRLGVRKRKQRLGKGAVRGRLMSHHWA